MWLNGTGFDLILAVTSAMAAYAADTIPYCTSNRNANYK
jgi:hypothetical protein